MYTIDSLANDLNSHKLTSRELVEHCLARIEDTDGEGTRAFLTVYKDQALAEADLADAARAKSVPLAPFAGIPLSIKDLFDCAGEVTRAGSRVLDTQPPAPHDAVIVAALRRAGFIIIGKNNMTEFAYSGLGINGHFGTPLSPFERHIGRIPGGSTSGGAVSISDAMAVATIGTDTGGSCRIPAAFCGITGLKPTSYRVSQAGVFPLSSSLDSVGPLANSVSCCAILDSVISGGNGDDVIPLPRQQLNVGVLGGYLTEQIDEQVATVYESALRRLAAAGVRLTEITIEELSELPEINRNGGLVGAEAFALHRKLIESRKSYYDPWVLSRLEFAREQKAADYIAVLHHRKRMKKLVRQQTQQFDVLLMPTVQIIPPAIESLQDTEISGRINRLCLRNTAVGNFLDQPSITLPCQEPGTAPVGLMLMGKSRDDRRLLSIAASLESVVRLDAGLSAN